MSTIKPQYLLIGILWLATRFGLAQSIFLEVNFDNCTAMDKQSNLVDSVAGMPRCECGVKGESFKLDGQRDFVNFTGDYKNIFSSDYTISFYFKVSTNSTGQALDLLSLREDCGLDSSLAFTYLPTTKEVSVEIYENVNRNALLVGKIDPSTCWQHLTMVRQGVLLRLYINGKLALERRNSQPIAVNNRGVLSISNSPCLGFAAQRFNGWIDELHIYRGALVEKEVLALYNPPDRIISPDTALIKGSSLQVRLAKSCATSFRWSPSVGVSDIQVAEPQLSPQVTTTYYLAMNDAACSLRDSIKVIVVDPATINCEEIFLPNAFTPNGDGLNEDFGISNPYVFEELLEYSVFSSWGEKMFTTTDAYGRWDGFYRGQPVNPGVYAYRLEYKCSGEHKIKTGSFTLLR